MKCQICNISVVNYQVHLTDNYNCRNILDDKIMTQNTEALRHFIESEHNPKIIWTTEIYKNGIPIIGKKLCTTYIVGKSNKKLISNVYSELLNILKEHEIKFPDHNFKIEVYSLINCGFIDYKNVEPNGAVGLAIRERILMEKK